ncbi:hypothetical protein ACTXT7_009887 [Hymenolepis weldensis]
MIPPFLPQGLGVNTDANAYVETLQTIVVKPPWIDSVANKIWPHLIKLSKLRIGWMDRNFHHHVTSNLCPPHDYSPDLNPLDYYVDGFSTGGLAYPDDTGKKAKGCRAHAFPWSKLPQVITNSSVKLTIMQMNLDSLDKTGICPAVDLSPVSNSAGGINKNTWL